MPHETSPGKPTTRRYTPEENDQTVRMVRQLRKEMGTGHGTIGTTIRRLGLAAVVLTLGVVAVCPQTEARAAGSTEVVHDPATVVSQGTRPAAEGEPGAWRRVSAGTSHTCAIRLSRRLYCWGSDRYGQLGDGGTNVNQADPVEVAGGGEWAAVSAGGTSPHGAEEATESHTCAIKTTGQLYCWGDDTYGQLGHGGPNVNQVEPVEVDGGGTDWASVTTGGYHTCALKDSGRLYCWGSDGSGRLGNGGTDTDENQPVEVEAPIGSATNWVAVSAGESHSCALRTRGRLYCWGSDGSGELGDGFPEVSQPAPVQVGVATTWAAVTTGAGHTCATKTNGRLYCWGWGDRGQLGNGGHTNQYTPTQVGVATNWSAVEGGFAHTCGRKSNGRLFCWGSDDSGELGDGMPLALQTTPVPVVGGTNWGGIAAGGAHTCALKTNRRLLCWGGGGSGQLGIGVTTTSQPTPVRVS